MPRITERIKKLKPGPAGPMPILIGGGGEKVTLKLVAQYAQMWNAFGEPDEYARKSRILDDWCHKIGRDPKEIERTANLSIRSPKDIDEWLKAGVQHFILRMAHPFDTKAVERLLKASRS
jgi:alkanesulfonate monooxygenase SsuD/methylene tetrahydromethanopterin reductase-like flavin-dependent oxidoreductase (luciferase family)